MWRGLNYVFGKFGKAPSGAGASGILFDYDDLGGSDDPNVPILDPVTVVAPAPNQPVYDWDEWFRANLPFYNGNVQIPYYDLGDWTASPPLPAVALGDCTWLSCPIFDNPGDPDGEDPYSGSTAADRALCMDYPIKCATAVLPDREKATTAASALASKAGVLPHDNIFDAIRHALWSALMDRDIGGDLAKAFGDAHEPLSWPSVLEHMSSCQDQYNNAVGRSIGQSVSPTATDDEVLQAVMNAASSGQLKAFPYRCW